MNPKNPVQITTKYKVEFYALPSLTLQYYVVMYEDYTYYCVVLFLYSLWSFSESPLLDIVQSEMDNSSKGFSKAPTYLVDGRGYKFVTVQHI